MRIDRKTVFTAALLSGAAIALTACGKGGEDKIARGKYLATIAVCGDCHSPGALMGKPDEARYLGSSEVSFFLPELGYFHPPNLTSDEETGLGKWTEEEIVTALRTGKRPDGRVLAPIMPWMSLAKLTDEDAYALAAFLKSLPPISNKVPDPLGATETAKAPYMTVVMPQPAPAAPASPAPPPEGTPAPAPETPAPIPPAQ